MAKLTKIWIEENESDNRAVRLDWDNDRHQRIVIYGTSPDSLIFALGMARSVLIDEKKQGKI